MPVPKIHQVGDVVFAHAGIFRDTQGKLDVVAAATSSIRAGGNLVQIVERFTTAIEPQLSASLPDIRTENPLYFNEKLKRPLEMLFASARSGEPQTIIVFFEVIDPSANKLAFRHTLLRCPGDCPQQSATTIGLGEHDAADQFLDSHPDILGKQGAIAAIQGAIAYQASATPNYVSLPTTIVMVDSHGVHF